MIEERNDEENLELIDAMEIGLNLSNYLLEELAEDEC